jgi:hypothetical protein
LKRSLVFLSLAAAFALPSSQAEAGDVMCPPSRGAVTIGANVVVVGSCTLDGTRVRGNVTVEDRGNLLARRADIDGNVQTDGARRVRLLRTDVDGSVQLEGLTSSLPSVVDRSDIEGSIQVKQNRSPLALLNNFVDEDVQAFTNRGGVRIELNVIGGNLQCKENSPRPTGFGNRVGGNKEDQCRGL